MPAQMCQHKRASTNVPAQTCRHKCDSASARAQRSVWSSVALIIRGRGLRIEAARIAVAACTRGLRIEVAGIGDRGDLAMRGVASQLSHLSKGRGLVLPRHLRSKFLSLTSPNSDKRLWSRHTAVQVSDTCLVNLVRGWTKVLFRTKVPFTCIPPLIKLFLPTGEKREV